MSVWQDLHSREGELLSVSITVEAYLLEDLLDTLAHAPFPINPEIHHHAEVMRDGRPAPAVRVEFPAWRSFIEPLQQVLGERGFASAMTTHSMLEEIRH
jgi:hypothetical protein